jgi:phosphoribosylformylglycinamidine synthase II
VPRVQGAARSLTLPPVASSAGLSPEECSLIKRRLGRRPNNVEWGMLGAMWSEHCGYKNSRPLLKRLPTNGPRVLQGPGENAGAVDIGHGLAVVLKMESHNHPSAVEPYEGAATGVGGILRDIFTMGARPIALLNSLRFGRPGQARTRYLLAGVVGGIGGYGNCVGVPTIGGEIYFDSTFADNPLVNAMCVGLVRHEQLTRARAGAAGDPVLVVGADTGRDGIHGATFASAELDEAREASRPAVQVGNPFLEKLLMEACLELLGKGQVVAMQDLGAAGLTSSSVEVAARGGTGVELEVQRVSRREEGMSPYEVMLSESQERMLLIVRQGQEADVQEHFARWRLRADVVGRVTDDGLIRVLEAGRTVAELPISLLTEGVPAYVRSGQPAQPRLAPALPPEPADLSQTLLQLLASENISSRFPAYSQYDSTVQANTVIGPSLDAALLRIRESGVGVAVSTDCNPRYCDADPYVGAEIAVAEAARNLACRGAAPIAATDCLNFGNPEKPQIYWQLERAVDGLADACRALGVPVVSGNVSLYNETQAQAIKPSPIVGLVGLIDDYQRAISGGLERPGDSVVLLGPLRQEVAVSEYLALCHGLEQAPAPSLDLEVEARVQDLCRLFIADRLLRSAHDCSEGGLAVTITEACIAGQLGFSGQPAALDKLVHAAGGRMDLALFGEAQSRIVVSCPPERTTEVLARAAAVRVEALVLGSVGGDRVQWSNSMGWTILDARIENVTEAWTNGLEQLLS